MEVNFFQILLIGVTFYFQHVYPLQQRDRLWSSESDVCRRQILMSKVYPRTVRVKLFIMILERQL